MEPKEVNVHPHQLADKRAAHGRNVPDVQWEHRGGGVGIFRHVATPFAADFAYLPEGGRVGLSRRERVRWSSDQLKGE